MCVVIFMCVMRAVIFMCVMCVVIFMCVMCVVFFRCVIHFISVMSPMTQSCVIHTHTHDTHTTYMTHTHTIYDSHTHDTHTTHIRHISHICMAIRKTIHLLKSCPWCVGNYTISRLLKIIGLFCRISSLLKGSFAFTKETQQFEAPNPLPIESSATKEPCSCRALLQRRPSNLWGLLIVTASDQLSIVCFEAATMSSLHKLLGLFCKRALQEQGSIVAVS